MAEDFIPTYSGERFYYRNPQQLQVKLEDIAHGLAMNPRFGGQCQKFYSVALHSVLVSKELENQGYSKKIQFYGLLHDAPEAYMGDVPAPLKKELENVKQIEENIMNVIWNALDIQHPTGEEWRKVKQADKILLYHEASELVSRDNWAEKVDRDYNLTSGSRKEDKERFLSRFTDLNDS